MMTRSMKLAMAASTAGMLGFYLLFSALPLYAATGGGAGGSGAGAVTGVMMLATVLAEPTVPWLLSRFGYRAVMALGLTLLGLPALLLPLSAELPLVLAVSLLRGAGLGILVVVGTAITAELVPAERRGEGLGLYGVAVGVPSILGLPLGLWASDTLGFTPVLIIAALVPLAGLVATAGLPATRPARATGGPGLGLRGLAGPAVLFGTTAVATGVMVTFLPLAGSPGLASVALLAQSLATPTARWVAGRLGDRHGSARLLVPGLSAAVGGVALQVWVGSPVAVVAGMALFGVGFGVLQNATLALMFERGAASTVSALWNLAYDAGMGVGAMGFGLVLGLTGYPAGFAMVAVLVAVTLPLARAGRTQAPLAR
ncbi:MFS transporter [Nonomuraea jiangxiensis]|uniref:Predicted arabinose efflux permease, MFS family n=1 Tax=Nonomuraea jiangxiensis TaxID=633440 RepID=A0A1G9RTU2_9ACTN|nr:MFS transporter [Nonomuraea jiangxiensis]SDM26651.1 Predicted arabinose efflux permease, MFS family [Nonomuraea jiangxiensis]